MASESTEHSQQDENVYLVRLRRLWKGSLYVCIAVIHVVLVSLAVVFLGWIGGLLTFALVLLSMVFRFVASEVDRIGWALSMQPVEESANGQATAWRRALMFLLALAMHTPIVILIWYVWSNLNATFGIGTLFLFVVAEVLYQEIRRTNRKVAFRQASYGQRDGSLVFGVPASSNRSKEIDDVAAIEQKEQKLREMVGENRISPRAFRKAKDRLWVKHVLESDD